MTIKEYYSEIVELSAQFIELHGYKRSGKSGIFYKYNSDKTKGHIIGFKKSLDNTPDFCKFIIKFGHVDVGELCDIGLVRNKIRLEDLKRMIMSEGYSACDSIYVLDDFIIEYQSVNDFYKSNIFPELDKMIKQLSMC